MWKNNRFIKFRQNDFKGNWKSYYTVKKHSIPNSIVATYDSYHMSHINSTALMLLTSKTYNMPHINMYLICLESSLLFPR